MVGLFIEAAISGRVFTALRRLLSSGRLIIALQVCYALHAIRVQDPLAARQHTWRGCSASACIATAA